MALKIRINNLNKKRSVARKSIRKGVLSVLRDFKKSEALIDVTFVSDRRIRELNKKYMRKASSTDVLSFLLEDKLFARKGAILGDIYISSDTARRNAKRFKTSYQKEILLYAIHGMLHLLGFGDKTFGEKSKIRKLEKRFLEKIVRKK